MKKMNDFDNAADKIANAIDKEIIDSLKTKKERKMMEFELNANSWHFYLANYGARRIREWRDDNDFCSYMRAVIKGLMLFTIVYGLALFAIGLTLNMLYEFYGFFINDVQLSVWAECTYMIYGIAFAMCAILFFMWFTAEKAIPAIAQTWRNVAYGKRKEERPPTFLGLAYRKFKDKTCFKIKFKSKEE